MNNTQTNMFELVNLAIELANSLQLDIEENPDAASNETIIILQKLRDKANELDESLDRESGLQ